jgi:hypothetical protein
MVMLLVRCRVRVVSRFAVMSAMTMEKVHERAKRKQHERQIAHDVCAVLRQQKISGDEQKAQHCPVRARTRSGFFLVSSRLLGIIQFAPPLGW